ncbi:aquaporin [Microbacterium gorillae]|uniref:aquaporin n=1 Tax=Microbacterium gorillae TaxID=1231063 RepID=UPI003D986020
MSRDPRTGKSPASAASTSVQPTMGSRLAAEALGTFLLVFGLIGAALFSSHLADAQNAPAPGIVPVVAAVAVGLTVIMGAYAFGPISGGHFNPAVTLGLAAAGRFAWKDALPYIIAQVIGGVVASSALVLIGLFGPAGWLTTAQDGGFASNGWGKLSPGGFDMPAAIIIEVIITALFLFVILGVTHAKRGTQFGGLVIGLSLTLFLLVAVPVDNASLNPARSLATAIYGGGDALSMLWVFLVFPIVGALLAGFSYRALFDNVQKR